MLHSVSYVPKLLPNGVTPVFEIVYPDNRIVVDYKGEEFLSLLTIFEHNGEEWSHQRVSDYASRCGFRRPRQFHFDLNRDADIPFENDLLEGYVIRFNNGLRVKAKDPRYVKAHRLLEHMSVKGVIALMREGDYGIHIKALPKELQKGFDDIRAQVQSARDLVERTARNDFSMMIKSLPPNSDRKTYALWIQEHLIPGYWGMMFALLDGKEIDEQVWKETMRVIDRENSED
jgi:RNA ligase